MATTTTHPARRTACAFWLIFPVGALMVVLIAGATLAATPSMRLVTLAASPTARLVSWAPMSLAKPTYTPSPVPTFTPIPPTAVPPDTATPGVVLADAPSDVVSDSGTSSDLSVSYPQDPAGTDSGKYVLVSISEQHMYAYEAGQLIYSFVASTGMNNSTATGTFHVLDKIPNAYGSTWNIWMPNWLGIYYSGTLENGIHALPILPNGNQLWAGFLGTPISFGCVVLGPDEATQLYNWVDIGTPVEIRW